MQAAQDSFVSSTYWTEGVGPAAALATIRKMRGLDVPAHVQAIGRQWQAGMQAAAERHRLPLTVAGHPALSSIAFDHPEALGLQTLLTARMLDHRILAGAAFYPCLAHQPRHVAAYLAAADEVFAELANCLRDGNIAGRIGGPVKHTGFARLT